MGVIYKATNLVNNKSYIGQTKNFEKRKKQHLKAKDDYVFHQALRKYGKDNFLWEIIEECADELLDDKEIYWIDCYRTFDSGYNMTSGGDNADALDKWRQENPDKVKKYALNGLSYANKWREEHPEESLAQVKEAQKRGADAVKRKVLCIEKNLVFDSLSEAERWSISDLNDNHKKASHQHISKVCKGERQTCGGYHWKYVT